MPAHAAQLNQTALLPRTAAVFQAWLKQPSQVASICPSSGVLTQAIADRECIRNASRIVDLGPGTGGTTSAILREASPNCRLLAIEKTSEFIPPLTAIDDPRLAIQEGDVIDLERFILQHGMTSPDVIVSGIPFSSIPAEAARSIMAAVHRTLPENGVFIAYQLRNHVQRYASEYFHDQSATETVWFNVPPLRIFGWIKRPVENHNVARQVVSPTIMKS